MKDIIWLKNSFIFKTGAGKMSTGRIPIVICIFFCLTRTGFLLTLTSGHLMKTSWLSTSVLQKFTNVGVCSWDSFINTFSLSWSWPAVCFGFFLGTFCYRINSRLFAAPLDPRAACPVCKMPKEKHPHTEHEPAFIRCHCNLRDVSFVKMNTVNFVLVYVTGSAFLAQHFCRRIDTKLTAAAASIHPTVSVCPLWVLIWCLGWLYRYKSKIQSFNQWGKGCW